MGTEADGTPPGALVEPIAIIGMAVKVPGADSLDEYWQNLAGGVESIRFFTADEQRAMGVPADRLDDPGFVPAAAMLDDVGYFDAGYFGMTPREAEIRDPQQRLWASGTWCRSCGLPGRCADLAAQAGR